MRFALCLALVVFPAAALAQTCAAAAFGDGVCDCGCGSVDPDCPAGAKFTACVVSHCPAGKVPWEHQPNTCMASACGDGWNDTVGGEVCDDKNALASGGCAANCRAVNQGYVCGERANGCQTAPVDAGGGIVDAGSDVDAGAAPSDAGTMPADGGQVTPMPMTQGCQAVGAGGSIMALSLLLISMRRRRWLA